MLTSFNQLLLLLFRKLSFFTKQASINRRSTALSLSLQVVFTGTTNCAATAGHKGANFGNWARTRPGTLEVRPVEEVDEKAS